MKMRKALSFVLILALVLGSFSMAFAAPAEQGSDLSDIAGNANYDAIVAGDIVKGLYLVDFDGDGYVKAVTEITDTGNYKKDGGLTTTTIEALDYDKSVITIDDAKYELADDVVVYIY